MLKNNGNTGKIYYDEKATQLERLKVSHLYTGRVVHSDENDMEESRTYEYAGFFSFPPKTKKDPTIFFDFKDCREGMKHPEHYIQFMFTTRTYFPTGDEANYRKKTFREVLNEVFSWWSANVTNLNKLRDDRMNFYCIFSPAQENVALTEKTVETAVVFYNTQKHLHSFQFHASETNFVTIRPKKDDWSKSEDERKYKFTVKKKNLVMGSDAYRWRYKANDSQYDGWDMGEELHWQYLKKNWYNDEITKFFELHCKLFDISEKINKDIAARNGSFRKSNVLVGSVLSNTNLVNANLSPRRRKNKRGRKKKIKKLDRSREFVTEFVGNENIVSKGLIVKEKRFSISDRMSNRRLRERRRINYCEESLQKTVEKRKRKRRKIVSPSPPPSPLHESDFEESDDYNSDFTGNLKDCGKEHIDLVFQSVFCGPDLNIRHQKSRGGDFLDDCFSIYRAIVN